MRLSMSANIAITIACKFCPNLTYAFSGWDVKTYKELRGQCDEDKLRRRTGK